MAKDDPNEMVFTGTVVDSNKSIFKVQVDDPEMLITCTISGKIRTNSVKILVGDVVDVVCSAYDTTKGRITYRRK